MSTTPNQKDLLAKKTDLEGILKPDANDILHLPDITITLAENGQFYLAGISKKLLTLIGNTSGNAVTLDGDAGLTFTTSGGSSTITGITSSSGNSTSLAASQSMVSAKQDALTAGTNITISNNTISATDTNTLSDLTDTAISSLADGQVLKYNATSGKWVNGTGGGGAEVILGTTAPTAAQGSNGNLYIQYDDTNNNTVTHEYVKISGAWEEITIGGGGGSTTTVTVTPKVLTGTNIADITVGNGNTTDIYDYAYFDGSGYYETPFIVDTDYEYEITFEANYDTTMAVIGTYAGANYFHLTIYNNYWYVGTNSGEVHPSAYTTGKHTFKTDSSHTYLDDTQFTSYTPAVVNNYITIGARENTYLYKGKFYEFKIKSISTGNVLYDLVPGMRGTTKGLYDLVSDTFVECSFITNMGTKTGTSGGVTTQLYAPSIEANPSGTATDSLSSIEIDGTIYSIEGGGGGGSRTTTEEIYKNTAGTIPDTINLTKPINDFDIILISGFRSNAPTWKISSFYVSSAINQGDVIELNDDAYYAWYTVTDLSTLTKNVVEYDVIDTIYGLKFGSGGGGGGSASPDITLLNDGTITDGQYVLSEPISKFDEINFIIQYRDEYINSKNYYPKDLLRLSSSSTDPYGVTNFLIDDYGSRYLYCQYIDETHIKPLEIYSELKGIYGIKYKGGGGGDASAEEITLAEYSELTTAEKNDGTIRFIPESNIGYSLDIDFTNSTAYKESGMSNTVNNNEVQIIWPDTSNAIGFTIYPTAKIDVTNYDFISYNLTSTSSYSATYGDNPLRDLGIGLKSTAPNTMTLAPNIDYTVWNRYSVTDVGTTFTDERIDVSNLTGEYYLIIACAGWNATVNNIVIGIEGGNPSQIKYMDKTYAENSGAPAMKLTQAEYDALTQEEKENGTIYFVGGDTSTQLIERVSAADNHITSSGHSGWGGEDWGAFDGTPATVSDITNAWCALEDDATPWIQYHFDQPYYLTKLVMVVYQHYNASSSAKTVNMNILGSNDGITWTNIAADGQTKSVTFKYQVKDTIEIELNLGQYEYIRIRGTEVFNIAYNFGCDFDEIYVYGGANPITLAQKIYYMGKCYTNTGGGGGGSSSHAYSTTEQKVGTWIDGSDIYEKSFEVTITETAPVIEQDASYIDALISYDAVVKNTLGYISGVGMSASGWNFALHRNPSMQLLLWGNISEAIGGKAYVTIRYTKVTQGQN